VGEAVEDLLPGRVGESHGGVGSGMAQTLSGVRVLDLSTIAAGAIATMLLADHGADVIKVEPPGGDPVRGHPGSIVWNRSKRSIVLDLEEELDRGRFGELCADADVVVHTATPAVAARLGLDGAARRAANPRLVTCSITGYGSKGSASERPFSDALVQARSGLQYEQTGRRDGPIFLHAPLPTFGAALLATTAISAALLVRERTGEGQDVETSLAQGSLVWTTQVWKRAERPTEALTQLWRFRDLVPTPCYEASDGRWLHPMPKAIPVALEHLGRDPADLATIGSPMSADRAEREAYFAAAREVFRQRPRDEWVELLQSRSVPCQPIQPAEDAFDHPQVVATGAVVTVDVPEVGPIGQVGAAYLMDLDDLIDPAPPPGLGAHTDDVLARASGPRTASGTASPARATPTVHPSASGRLEHPLSGVRVLDLGTVVAGPFGAMILADLGADVIKVEPLTSTVGASVGTPGDATWVSSNRGKRCIAVDLKSADGREVLDRLIASADVVHDNLRLGVAERLGFDHARAASINPRIISSHLTAYGRTGPIAHWPGSDQMAQALCGLEWEQGATPAGGHPTWYRFGMTDAVAGLLCAIAIVQALRERERTGRGQAVESDILRAGMLLASDAFVGADVLPRRAHLDLAQTGLGPWTRLYETADGWICVDAATRAQRDALAAVLGVPFPIGVADAADHADHPDGTDGSDGTDGFEAAFTVRSAEDWSLVLDDAGVPNEVARDRGEDWCDDPDARANGWVANYEHPVWGRLEQPGAFFALSATPPRIETPPPLIGQHTDEVLGELGFTAEQIAQMRERGTVAG
jgi:crotonobetainyl-CoA:carnitine CoA-transferase CaiB-like acyl-CoA transferase